MAQTKQSENLMLGMDALAQELDGRYCNRLPKGNKSQEIQFIRQAFAKYKEAACYVLSADDSVNQ